MKGIVADIKGKYAVVLSRDGSFIKVRNNGLYSIGSEIDTVKPAGINTRMLARVSSMAAGAILVMGVSFGAYSYTVPYSLVDVDINPSIEITTNIYDRIIKTEALNEDGQKLLLTGSLKHSSLDEGITVILNNAVQQGYLKGETAENAVVFTIISKDVKKSEKLQKGLETAATTELKAKGVVSELVVGKASQQEHDSAREIGLTPGKLNLIEKAIEAEPGLKLEDLKDAPVRDIMKKIKENRKEDKQDKQDSQDKQGNQDNKQGKQGNQDNKQGKQGNQDNKQGKQDNQDNKQGKQDNQDSKQGKQDNQDSKQGKQDMQDSKQDKQDKQNNNQDVKKNENSDNTDNANTGNGNSDAITEESSTVSGHVVVNDQSGNGKSDNVEGNSKSDNKKDYNNN